MKFDLQLNTANRELDTMEPRQRIAWAVDTFKDSFCITSSFGIQSAVMVHLVSQAAVKIPVLFLDTGYHFAETLAYKDYLQKRLGLNVVVIKPELLRMEFEEKFGNAALCDPDLCCKYNKVIPLQKALADYTCWATGIRRVQTPFRQNVPILDRTGNGEGRYKLAPIADLTDNDVTLYLRVNELPDHPLAKKGYESVGCYPCTSSEDKTRAGRWTGKDKTECGIHVIKGRGEGI